MFNYIYRCVGHRQDAEDLLQDVFMKIHKSLPAEIAPEEIRPWIFTVTRNTIRDYYRRRKVRENYLVDTEDISEFIAGVGNNSFSPEKYVLTAEMQAKFEKIIPELPVHLKEVFLLRHQAGLSFKQIAEMLDCPVNRLLGRMHLAMKKIRHEMEKYLKEGE